MTVGHGVGLAHVNGGHHLMMLIYQSAQDNSMPTLVGCIVCNRSNASQTLEPLPMSAGMHLDTHHTKPLRHSSQKQEAAAAATSTLTKQTSPLSSPAVAGWLRLMICLLLKDHDNNTTFSLIWLQLISSITEVRVMLSSNRVFCDLEKRQLAQLQNMGV